MITLQRLLEPIELGPVRIANRAVFVARGLPLVGPDGDLTDSACDFLLDLAQREYGLVLIDWDELGHPFGGELPRRLASLPEANAAVTWGVSFCGAVPEVAGRLVNCGFRVVEADAPSVAIPGAALGLRVERLRDADPSVDYVHFRPSAQRYAAMVGGTARHPLVDELSVSPVPLLLSGRVKDAVAAERVLAHYPIALVGLTRGAVAEPALVSRGLVDGNWRVCTGCQACRPEHGAELGCAVRPLGASLPSGGTTWDIVGTSVAGCELALALVSCGHSVTLWRAGYPVGGALRLRGRIPDQGECSEAAVELAGRLRASEVSVRSGAPDELAAEHVLLCLPERFAPDAVAGLDALEVLLRGAALDTRYRVRGETLLAAEVAAYLEMKALDVELVASSPASAGPAEWAAYYRSWFRERQIHCGVASSDPRIEVAAGQGSPHELETASKALRPDAIVVADRWDPSAQRAGLQRAFAAAANRLERGRAGD